MERGIRPLLTILCRSVILYIMSLLAMRLMGQREVGQLQPYELVVVIMIAELASTPMGGVGIPILYGILPMLALVVCHGFIAFFCMKSPRLRALVSGQPMVIMREGVICVKQLRRAALDLNDLLEAVRQAGFMDISEVDTAVLEPGGRISVFPKASKRPATPEDLHIAPAPEHLALPLVMDGHVHEDNLARAGLTEAWAADWARKAGFACPADVFFMSLNSRGELLVQGKGRDEAHLFFTHAPKGGA